MLEILSHTTPVVVQIESESYPDRNCYLQWDGEIWARHTNIASSFENRVSAILTVEKLRRDLTRLGSESVSGFVSRLRHAKFIPVSEVDDDIYIRKSR